MMQVSCGVPQGSILGPLLFVNYANDVSQAVKSNLFLYADDSCLMYQHKDLAKIEKILKEPFSLKMYIGSAKTYDFCMFVCFAFMYTLISCLHTCMLLSDIKSAHRQNIRK